MQNKFCPSCGQEIKDNGAFCINCGYKLNVTNNTNNNVVDNSHVNNNSTVYNDFNNINPETMTMTNQNPNTNNNVNYNYNSNNPAMVQATVEYKNTAALVGLICGIVGMLCCCNLLISGCGLGFSISGLNKAKEVNGTGKGMAIAGIVLSGISLAISVMAGILAFIGEFM